MRRHNQEGCAIPILHDPLPSMVTDPTSGCSRWPERYGLGPATDKAPRSSAIHGGPSKPADSWIKCGNAAVAAIPGYGTGARLPPFHGEHIR